MLKSPFVGRCDISWENTGKQSRIHRVIYSVFRDSGSVITVRGAVNISADLSIRTSGHIETPLPEWQMLSEIFSPTQGKNRPGIYITYNHRIINH